jgi:hypothetical protein
MTVKLVYDDSGERVSETYGSTTITYLNDPDNATGTAQTFEEHVNGGPSYAGQTYMLGLQVFGQTVLTQRAVGWSSTDGELRRCHRPTIAQVVRYRFGTRDASLGRVNSLSFPVEL